jgi:kynureninase
MSKSLRGMGVVPDHRPPDILRLAPPPWAVSEGDIAAVVSKILDAARGVQDASGDDGDHDLVP